MKKKLLKLALSTLLTTTLLVGATGCGTTESGQTQATDSTQVATETSGTTDSNESQAAEASSEAVGTTESLQALRIGIGGSDGNGLLEGAALALENGYFEEELKEVGYYPEYVYFTGAGPEINEAFAGGRLDAAIVGDFPTLVAKSNGIDTTIIAVTNQKVNYGILTTVPDATSVEDLVGKTAVVYNGSIVQYFWENYLTAKGIGYSDIPVVNSADASTLLSSGDAQVYPITAYVSYYYESLGLGHVIDTSDADIWTTFVFELATPIVNSNPEVAVAVNKALIRAAEAAQADPQSHYEALGSENITAASWEKYYSADPTLANLSPEITDELVDYYKKENQWLLDHGVIISSIDIDTYVNTTFYQQAKDALAK